MKIIYDVSVLGLGYYYKRARTGIYRATENIVTCLMHSKECQFMFCAFRSFPQFIQSMKYANMNPALSHIDFCHPQNKILKKIGISLLPVYAKPNANLFYLFWRKLFTLAAFSMSSSYQCLDGNTLRSADIFHSSFYPLPRQVRELKKIEKFITVYDLIPIRYPQYCKQGNRVLLKNILNSIDRDTWIITISHATKNDLCNYSHVDPSRVFVTHLATSDFFYKCVDPQMLTTIRDKYNIPDSPYILSLSTLEPRKNIDHTMRCFIRLIQEQHISDLNLVLVGIRGWDYDEIFSEIAKYPQLRNRILITGYVPDSDLAPLYSGAMMFVYPSLYEGFGLPPLEAMQCGVPVITSNTSSLPEVVGNAGFMVEPTDGDALCQRMLELYSCSSLRSKMSLKSLNQAGRFSWAKCASETVNAYKTALS